MPTIVLEQQRVELSVEQILAAIKQLTPEELSGLQRELLGETWRARMNLVLDHIRRNVAAPLTEADIRTEVETVRGARYAQSHS